MDPDGTGATPGPLAAAGGRVLGAAFARVARARRGKPLHPRGTVVDAVLRRSGTRRRWGAPWLDEPGEDVGIVRLSRSLGLPAPLPDVLGLALRFRDGSGTHDLLLATTGLGRTRRFLLLPRTDPTASAYTSLLPYRAPGGPVVLAAAPAPAGAGTTSGSGGSLRLRLLAAAPAGAWEPFGDLEVALGDLRGAPAPDAPIAFDPVLHPLPGLVIPAALATVREGAYAGARRGRGQPVPA